MQCCCSTIYIHADKPEISWDFGVIFYVCGHNEFNEQFLVSWVWKKRANRKLITSGIPYCVTDNIKLPFFSHIVSSNLYGFISYYIKFYKHQRYDNFYNGKKKLNKIKLITSGFIRGSRILITLSKVQNLIPRFG